jgi:hypothetical protein
LSRPRAWQGAFAQPQQDGVPVEGLKAEMAHIEGEVGGTFGRSLFTIQVMDSSESARALARRVGKTSPRGRASSFSKVLVNSRLVGSYVGDRGHAAVFTETFNHL